MFEQRLANDGTVASTVTLSNFETVVVVGKDGMNVPVVDGTGDPLRAAFSDEGGGNFVFRVDFDGTIDPPIHGFVGR